jgi:hypothetical protein
MNMARKRWGPGNPLWEWKKKHAKGSTRKSSRKSVKHMARKKSRGSGSMLGSVSPKKLLVALATGAGAMLLASKLAPQLDSRIAGGIGGFFAGGPLGAAVGALGPGFVLGMNTATANGATGGAKLF